MADLNVLVNTRKPYNILQILQGGKTYGGVENFVCKYYKQLDHTRFHFDFCFCYHDSMNKMWEQGFLQDSKHHVLAENTKSNMISLYVSLLKFLKEYRYDCIHINTGNLSIQLPCLLAAKRAHVKVLIAHSHSTGSAKKSNLLKKLCLDIVRVIINKVADVRAACSEDAAKHLFGHSRNVVIIPNAIDTKEYAFKKDIKNKFRSELGIEGKTLYLQVGSFSTVKNHLFSIDLFSELVKRNKNSVLLLAGEGDLEDEIKRTIKDKRLDDHVILLGFRNDIPDLMIASDCLLLPSLWEGFPTVAIEAQAAGLKCLCSNNITKSVIITDKCKLLPLTVQSWMDECLNIPEHNDDACELVANKGFDIVGAAKGLAEIYDKEISLYGRKHAK